MIWRPPQLHAPGAGRAGNVLITIILCLLCLMGGFAAGFHYQTWRTSGKVAFPATCLRIVDTDTIEVRWHQGTNKVRIAGIDAPESKDNKKLKEQAVQLKVTPENLLQVSKIVIRQTETAMKDKSIRLVFPHGRIEYDSFGRVLAYVEIGGQDFGEMLLRNGLVYPRPEPHPRKEAYYAINQQAMLQRKGIYGMAQKP